jgi:hypothetical protein
MKTLEREGVAVTVLNTQTNEVKEFTNQTEAGGFLGVTRQAVYNAIKRGWGPPRGTRGPNLLRW